MGFGDLLGGIFGGIEGYYQYKGMSKMADAYKEAVGIQKEQLNFYKQMYKDWYKVYGSLQEDLGTYFKNLTGDKISAKERQAIQKAMQETQEELSQMMAQRHIANSGLEASLYKDITFQGEIQKALSQANAEDKAVAMKSQFLGLGLGQNTQIAGGMSNVSANLSTTMQGYGQALGQQYNTIGNAIGKLGGYFTTIQRSPYGALDSWLK